MKYDPDGFARTVEAASRALFNRKYRLAVLAHVASRAEGAVYVREVARRLGIADNQIAPDFKALRQIGALEEVETPDRESWHRRVDHPVWGFARDTLRHLAERHSSERAEVTLSLYCYQCLGLSVEADQARTPMPATGTSG